jgi:hypothetical protein
MSASEPGGSSLSGPARVLGQVLPCGRKSA